MFSEIIKQIEAGAATRIKAEDGDYIKDGLLYCGKCNTPKQTEIEFSGIRKNVFCLCKCAKEAFEAEKEKRKQIEFEKKIKKLKKLGFPDSEIENWTFNKDDRRNGKISNIAELYVKNFLVMKEQGKGILFFGDVGTGKTFISACIANAVIEKGYSALMTNFARLVNTIQGLSEKQNYIDGLNRFDLIVIDDLAAERDTEYMNEIIYNVIDSRYRAGKPVIITTNLTAAELKKAADIKKQRLYSRLFEMCFPVEVLGADRRKEKLKNDFEEFKTILGL